jgi:hypothetical protein
VDFQSLASSTTKVVTEQSFQSLTWQSLDYEISDPAIWDHIITKWNLPSWIENNLFQWTGEWVHVSTLVRLIEGLEKTVKILEEYPTPKFQVLCLHHLPVEVLRLVYQNASLDDARKLSSTSKRMRSIGEPFIFGVSRWFCTPYRESYKQQSRVLELGISAEKFFRIRKDKSNISPEFLEAFQKLANDARQLYIDRAEFLLSREDILHKLNHLSLLNRWDPRSYEIKLIAGGHMPTVQEPSFFDPLHERNLKVLRHTTQITQLDIDAFSLSNEYLNLVHGFHALHSIEIRSCNIQDCIIDAVRQDRYIAIPTVANVRIVMSVDETWDDPESHPMWYLLPSFTNIKNLSIESFDRHVTLPPFDVLDVCNPFRTLERFAISRFNGWDVIGLANWVQSAVTADESLKLTHFRISTGSPMDSRVFATLLEVLSHAPQLHTCVFDGLAPNIVHPSVFRLISEHLPDIFGLTVVMCEDLSGMSRRSCTPWPGPMWEYAKEFTGFSRLQFLSWNNLLLEESMPIWMLLMEDGYPATEREEAVVSQWDDAWEGYEYDSERVAALFAAYCPTLLTIVNGVGRLCLWGYHINHQDGKKSFHSIEMGGLQTTRKWNTNGSSTMGQWPKIIPDQDMGH